MATETRIYDVKFSLTGTMEVTGEFSGPVDPVDPPPVIEPPPVGYVPPPVQAAPAQSLVDGFGVNTHFDWFDTTYFTLRDSHVVPAMLELGVKHFRTAIMIDDQATLAKYKEWNVQHGWQSCLVTDPGQPAQNQYDRLTKNFTVAQVSAVEGANEPADGALAGKRISELSDLVRANQAYKDVPIYAPSYLSAAAVTAGGNIASKVQRVNAHPYPGGNKPEGSMDYTFDLLNEFMPQGPYTVTEVGYHTKANEAGFQGVSVKAATIFLPRLLVAHLLHPTFDVDRVFFYEMMCNSASWATGTVEEQFGLLAEDGNKRPQYYAMKALLQTVKDPGTAFTPADINVELSKANAYVRLRALARRDGSYDLLLWQDVSVWNANTKADINVADVNETLTFSSKWKNFKYLRINDGNTPAWKPLTATAENKVTMPVSAAISILRVTT